MTARKSKWFWWSFLPFFNFAAWIHAAIRTGCNSYYWLAGIYGAPFAMAVVLGAIQEDLKLPKETVEGLNDVGGGAAAVLWIVGMIHVLLKKDSVDQQIHAHDTGQTSPTGVTPSLPSSAPLLSSSAQRQKVPVVAATADPPAIQPGAVQRNVFRDMTHANSSGQNTGKTFKYIDAHGNLIGPATMAALHALKQAGVISDSTRIIDQEAGRSFTAQQCFSEETGTGTEPRPDFAVCEPGPSAPPPAKSPGQTGPQEGEEFQRMLAEVKESFKISVAGLANSENVKPAPGEAIGILRGTYGNVLEALEEKKRLWLDLDCRARGQAERVRQREMSRLSDRIKAGEQVDAEIESRKVLLAELDAAQGVVEEGAGVISKKFEQKCRPTDLIEASRTCYTAVFDCQSFGELYAELSARYAAIVSLPDTTGAQQADSRFVTEEDIRQSILEHFDLSGSFYLLFKTARLKSAQAFNFQKMLENGFLSKHYSIDDQAYILGVPVDRQCTACQERVSAEAETCQRCKRKLSHGDGYLERLKGDIASRLEQCKTQSKRVIEFLSKSGMMEDSAKGIDEDWKAFKETSQKSVPLLLQGEAQSPQNPDARGNCAGTDVARPALPQIIQRPSPATTFRLPDKPPGTKPAAMCRMELLFLKRQVQEEPMIARCKSILDNWCAQVPFSPIKKLGSQEEFASATEYAAYKTTVTSQIEKRWLADHEVPYRGQHLPTAFRPGSHFDPWTMDFPRFADFASHHNSEDLVDTRQVYDCSRCHASGRITCSSCAGKGEVRCNSCDGYGHTRCWNCGGKGQLRAYP